MIDPFSELLRSGDTEALAQLYEAVAEIVCDTEDLEYQHGEWPEGSHTDRLIIAFNACESAVAEFNHRTAAVLADGDTTAAVLDTKAGLR